MPGPLPTKNPRRRNAPTIPTTKLPADGRTGPAPKCPYTLDAAGKSWWSWAWHTPQAAAWSPGDLYVVARRAQLEDDIVALGAVRGGLDLDHLVELGEDYRALSESIKYVVGKLQAINSGRSTIMREMREIDDRLGLTPKALAALRWQIAPDELSERRPTPTKKPARRLAAVDTITA